ncbi:MFS transporter [Bifidobacterium leontopitheci]|uniref:MFS transporter n=1 Tax=Bifidobacterium leontopitheci TaxID=2650774 RepID=A0A6I1GH15_9BIFI|nr:MFS transporter [Bifidobacterium leontopitheci]KAB7788966.1 MFS transporter [Bifidobacterium leontopitheci]
MRDDQQNTAPEPTPAPKPLPGSVYVRPGIDDRPDYDKALTPEDKAAVARLAVHQPRKKVEASVTQAETQAAQMIADGSPAAAAASVDAAVPDMASAYVDMRDPVVSADGQRPDARQVTRLAWGFALAALLSVMAWASLNLLALPALIAYIGWRGPSGEHVALFGQGELADLHIGEIGDGGLAVSWAWGLAVVIIVGVVVSLFAEAGVAALSDRTRTERGRRTPWIAAGGFLAALTTLLLGLNTSVVGIALLWGLTQVGYAMLTVPMAAAFSERVPDKFRPRVVRARGIGQMVGQALGVWLGVGGLVTGGSYLPFITAAVVFVIAGIVPLLVWPKEPSSEALARTPMSSRAFFDRFRAPYHATEFWKAFASRTLVSAGVGIVPMFLWFVAAGLIFRGWFVQGNSTALVMPVGSLIASMALATLAGSVIAAFIAGPAGEYVEDPRYLSAASCVLYAVAVALPMTLLSVTSMILFALIAGFAFGLIDTFGQLLAMSAMPDPLNAGHDLAFFNLSNSAGLLIAALAGAIGVQATGGFAVLFPIAIVCLIASALITLTMRA